MKESKYHVFFLNLSNSLKIEIISSLKEKENSVGNLSEKLGIEQSKLSHALSSLKRCNIVRVKQKGKQRIYYLNKDTIVPMLNLIDKHAAKYCIKCPYKK